MIVKQVWTMVVKNLQAITQQPRKFYESPTVLSEDAMWQTLESMQDESGCVPLIIERSLSWWKTKEMRGKTYSLVPFNEIELISSHVYEDNERIFLSDHIRGSTIEQ